MQGLKQKRHMGQRVNSGERLAVVYKQLPGQPETALVIFTDTIADADRTELLMLLDSAEGQIEEDFANALYKRNNYLAYFHKKGYLKPLHIDQIELLPQPNKPLPLRVVINAMNEARGLPTLEQAAIVAEMVTTPATSSVPTEAPLAESISEPVVDVTSMTAEDKAAVAKGLLFEANLLQAEVAKKQKEAYKLDPTLKPVVKKKRVKSAVKKTTPKATAAS